MPAAQYRGSKLSLQFEALMTQEMKTALVTKACSGFGFILSKGT